MDSAERIKIKLSNAIQESEVTQRSGNIDVGCQVTFSIARE